MLLHEHQKIEPSRLCAWGTETTVIRRIRFAGKLVEVWVDGSISSDEDVFDYCSQSYILTRAIEKAGLQERVTSHGYRGLGVIRRVSVSPYRCGLEIDSVFEANSSLL